MVLEVAIILQPLIKHKTQRKEGGWEREKEGERERLLAAQESKITEMNIHNKVHGMSIEDQSGHVVKVLGSGVKGVTGSNPS